MKRAIVVGASSGIGRDLSLLLSRAGYVVGVTARRGELLDSLQQEMPGESFQQVMDVADVDLAADQLKKLMVAMGGADLIVLNAGVAGLNPNLAWEDEKKILDLNVMGFAALAGVAWRHFMDQGHGHLVGVSSIAAVRGLASTPAYAASKAFVSNYLEGLRAKAHKAGKTNVHVTDIRPGYVHTPMTEGQKNMFWVATSEEAAKEIMEAIHKKKHMAYVTKRWKLVAKLLRHAPYGLHMKFQ